MAAFYRDEKVGAGVREAERLDEIERRSQEAAILADRWGPLFARRVARATGGAGWIFGFVTMVMAARSAGTFPPIDAWPRGLAWALGIACYAGGYALARVWCRRAIRAARLGLGGASLRIAERLDRLLRESLFLVLLGLSLLLLSTLPELPPVSAYLFVVGIPAVVWVELWLECRAEALR
jgi:hypothetical protein